MVVCLLLRLMYGSAEHVIATWTIVIAVARTAAAAVAVIVVFVVRSLRRNGKCCASRVLYRSHAENKYRLDVCSPEVIQQLVCLHRKRGIESKNASENQCACTDNDPRDIYSAICIQTDSMAIFYTCMDETRESVGMFIICFSLCNR